MALQSIVMEIGPEEAAGILEHDYSGNRKVNGTWVVQLADMMRRGVFESMNGQTIVLHEDGDLLDGQHRLWAIVESGATLPFQVATVGGDKRSVFETIDNGRVRKAADFGTTKYRSEVSCLAKVAYAIENGNQPLLSCMQGKVTSKTSASRIDITRYVSENADDLVSICGRAIRMRGAMKCGPTSSYSIFIYLVERFGNPMELDGFISECCELVPENRTVAAMAATIRNKYIAKTTVPEQKWLVGILLFAYKNYLLKNGMKMLNKWETALAEYDRAIKERRGGAA